MKLITPFSDSNWLSNSNAPRLEVFDNAESLPAFGFPRKNNLIFSIVCIQGYVELNIDLQSLVIREKSLAVGLPGHYIESFKVSDDFKGFLITSSQKNFEALQPLMSLLLICSLQFKKNPIVKLSDEEIQNQMLLHDLIRNKLNKENSLFDRLVIDKAVEAIFCETINIYIKRLDVKATTLCNRGESLFYRFIVAIEENYKQNRSVSFYSKKLNVTSKHLSAVVKELSGRTAGEWIDSYVITEIKQMLSSTNMTIQEISNALNFANQSFFGKYFKSHTGMSPREFRATIFAEQ
ncbi:MAG: AraC family transcriptional regulator [Muribaculaceae bacterium]|nr:AraC family transcriptional regulator [Muribaculaceae bacterium]